MKGDKFRAYNPDATEVVSVVSTALTDTRKCESVRAEGIDFSMCVSFLSANT